MSAVFTSDDVEAVSMPFVVMTGVHLVAAQAETLGDVSDDIFTDLLDRWPSDIKRNLVETVREDLAALRAWADRVESHLTEATS